MRAMICHELSNDISVLRMDNLELPPPGEGEVRMRIRACAVNFPDLLMIQGKYQFKPPLPFAPGMEVSGEIMSVGPGVAEWTAGDNVVAGMRYGGFADEANVPAESLREKPENLDHVHACCYRAAYLTAYVGLVRRGELQAGETLLVHGASGGVGLAAVEVGKLLGATVIATGSADDKLKVVRKVGADHVINYGADFKGGFKDRVKELTDGRGADVIYDPVGGDVFDESTRCIAWGGRLLVIGFTSGRIPSVPVNIPLIKGFSVVGVRAGEYGRRDPARGAENIAQIDEWARSGKIHPYVCEVFPLEDAVAAMRMLADRRVVGKVVLTTG